MLQDNRSGVECFVFWQQFASMHQIDLLMHISKTNPVKLIVDYLHDSSRVDMGWSMFEAEKFGIEIIINPDSKVIESLFLDIFNIHIFSGFSQGYSVLRGIVAAKSNSKAFFIMAEAPDFFKSRFFYSVFRLVKYYMFFMQNAKYIKGVLASGVLGLKFYKLMPIDKKYIFPFGYFINPSNKVTPPDDTGDNEKIRLIFVGRLLEYKGVSNLLKGLALVPATTRKGIELKIYGDGKLKNNLLNFSSRNGLENSVSFHNFEDNFYIREEIRNSDVLCLLNTSDEGWGVVVSEAILEGTYVLCSKYTGSSILLDYSDNLIGCKMNRVSSEDVRDIIQSLYIRLDSVRGGRDERKRWANRIHAETGARYFLQIMSHLLHSKEKTKAPWE